MWKCDSVTCMDMHLQVLQRLRLGTQFARLIVICNGLMEFWFSGDESWDILDDKQWLYIPVLNTNVNELSILFLPVSSSPML